MFVGSYPVCFVSERWRHQKRAEIRQEPLVFCLRPMRVKPILTAPHRPNQHSDHPSGSRLGLSLALALPAVQSSSGSSTITAAPSTCSDTQPGSCYLIAN